MTFTWIEIVTGLVIISLLYRWFLIWRRSHQASHLLDPIAELVATDPISRDGDISSSKSSGKWVWQKPDNDEEVIFIWDAPAGLVELFVKFHTASFGPPHKIEAKLSYDDDDEPCVVGTYFFWMSSETGRAGRYQQMPLPPFYKAEMSRLVRHISHHWVHKKPISRELHAV